MTAQKSDSVPDALTEAATSFIHTFGLILAILFGVIAALATLVLLFVGMLSTLDAAGVTDSKPRTSGAHSFG